MRAGRVKIYMLGEFRIFVDGKDILESLRSSKKKIALLQYLILNYNKPVFASNLMDMLWMGEEGLNLESALKTLVSRIRKDLAGLGLPDAILTKPGAYMWNPELGGVDVFEFEHLCTKLLEQKKLDKQSRAQFEEVIYLYTDDLLLGSELDTYVAPKSFYYHNLYLKTLYRYIELLNEGGEYDEVIRVCKTALEIDVFDSELNLGLMTALLKRGKNKEALTQYQNTTALHYTQLGVKPSDEILDFYKELIKRERSSEADIEEIRKELQEDGGDNGAFVCEYTIFKDIYQLQMRNLKRVDMPMFLVLVVISYLDNREVDSLVLEQSMKRLQDTMQASLRKGDTVARYSPTQYAALLPSVGSYDVGRKVLERVKTVFYRDSQNVDFVFNYKLAPLDAPSKA